MPPAARMLDPTDHPGVVSGPGVPTVLIGGLPAATVGTLHTCAFPGVVPHPPTPLVGPPVPTVLIGGMPAATQGTRAGCGAGVVLGFPTVLIGG